MQAPHGSITEIEAVTCCDPRTEEEAEGREAGQDHHMAWPVSITGLLPAIRMSHGRPVAAVRTQFSLRAIIPVWAEAGLEQEARSEQIPEQMGEQSQRPGAGATAMGQKAEVCELQLETYTRG